MNSLIGSVALLIQLFSFLFRSVSQSVQLLSHVCGGHKQNLVLTRTQEKGALTTHENDPDLPMNVQKSSAEAWVSGGLLQSWGALTVAVCAWDLLKEVAIIFITSTIVSV